MTVQVAVLRADEQRAVVVQRFGAAANSAVADLHRHVFADGRAAVLPIRRRRRQICRAQIRA